MLTLLRNGTASASMLQTFSLSCIDSTQTLFLMRVLRSKLMNCGTRFGGIRPRSRYRKRSLKVFGLVGTRSSSLLSRTIASSVCRIVFRLASAIFQRGAVVSLTIAIDTIVVQ